MRHRYVLGPCAAFLAAGGLACVCPAQTQADRRGHEASRDLNTENRVGDNYGERYDVYDPGAGYGGNLYLNNRFYVPSNPVGETVPQPNRSGLIARPPQTSTPEGDIGSADPMPAAHTRVRGEVVAFNPVPAADGRPAGLGVTLRTMDGERSFWLCDASFASSLPTISAGERVTLIVGSDVAQPGMTDVRVVETPAGRVQLPYYRLGEVVDAKLISTRREPAANGKPEAVIATIEFADGRQSQAVLATAAQLESSGIQPQPGDAVRIKGYLRSTPEQRWAFVVEDVELNGQSVRKAATDDPAATDRPRAKSGEPAQR